MAIKSLEELLKLIPEDKLTDEIKTAITQTDESLKKVSELEKQKAELENKIAQAGNVSVEEVKKQQEQVSNWEKQFSNLESKFNATSAKTIELENKYKKTLLDSKLPKLADETQREFAEFKINSLVAKGKSFEDATTEVAADLSKSLALKPDLHLNAGNSSYGYVAASGAKPNDAGPTNGDILMSSFLSAEAQAKLKGK